MIVYSLEPTADGPLFEINGADLNRKGEVTPGKLYTVFVRRTDTSTGSAVILPFTIVVTDYINAPKSQDSLLLVL